MGKRRRESDSDATLINRRADCNMVYVDTSLDTGIAMLVFETDTVADFKKKLVAEHKLCYPETELHIRYLKVKHDSRFYCLSDPMLVWSAFLGVERGWNLWVDASATPSKQNSSGLELVVSTKTVDDRNVDTGDLSSDINRKKAIHVPFPDGGAEKNDVLDIIPYVEFGNSLETESPAKKKRKTRHALGSTVDCQIPIRSDERKNDTLLEKTIIPDNLMVVSQKKYEPGLDMNMNIQDASEVEDTIKGKNIKPSPETRKSEEKEEEKVLITNRDNEDEMPSSYEAGSTQKKASKTTIPSNNKKKKNKKIEKMSADTNLEKLDGEKIDYDISGVPSGLLCLPAPQIHLETGKEESTMNCQNPIGSGEKKNDTFSESTIIPENLMVSKEYEPGLDIQGDSSGKRETLKETQNSPGDGHAAFPIVENQNQTVKVLPVEKDTENTVNTGKSVKKKRKRKTPSALDVQEDVQLKFLNGSTLGVTHVGEEAPGADGNEAEFVLSTQTKRTLEADASGKGENHKETQNSLGDGHAAFPVVEKENQIVKVLPVEKDTENKVHTMEKDTENKVQTGKSAKKKSKKKTLSTSDVQEDVQLKFLNGSTLGVTHVGEEAPGADGNEAEFVMSTQTKRTLEADASGKGENHKETQNSLGNGHSAFPVVEKENQIVKVLPVEKDTENKVHTMDKDTENKVQTGKSAKKKSKKKILSTSDVQEDVQLKFLNGSTLGVTHVGEEAPGADGNEAEFVMSTQTKRTLEADASGKGENHKETQNSLGNGHSAFPVVEKENQIVKVLPVEKDTENKVHTMDKDTENKVQTGKSAKKKSKKKILSTSDVQEDVQLKLLNSSTLDVAHVGQEVPGNGHADIPVEEKENQIVDSLQVEKDTENIVNIDKSAKKKRKNKALAASNVQEDLPDKNQIVGIGSSTEENSIKFVNSEVDGIHVASSQVISRKSKENPEKKHEIAVYTDDLAKKTENESEGVNFKQYFVPDHSQDKSGSHSKAKNPNQSDKDKKTFKKLKKNGSSSVSISTEVQSSPMISADGKRQNISLDRKDNGKGKGDSAQKSDRGEKIHNSSRRSSRSPENLVQDSITSETLGTLSKKPKEILSGSSLPKKKNDSLKKSSLERTEKFPEKRENKMPHFGVNDTNRMGLKTPEKKSLLTKQGSLFDYNSGESSGDDNGTLHSSDSTQSPSDSSYISDHSEGESELSLDSTKNGSSDAQARSTGGKGTPKLDLSAMKYVPVMTILQSSNRYKKAKLSCSQNEAYQNDSQPIEFVPDSQPV